MVKIKWHRSDSIGSTNSYLRELNGGDPGFDFEVAVADFQTAGRGQQGNKWESQAGKNLLFSILAHPANIKASEQFLISEAIALAVLDSVTQVVEPGLAGDFSVKWPNDIYWKDYKIAGILIENTLQGNLILDSVVGVGLNVNQELFLSDAPNPMSLKNITGQDFDRNRLLEDIVKRFIGYMEMVSDADTASDADVSSGLGKESVERLYHSRLYRREGWHRFRDAAGCFEAWIEGVRTNGLLLLETRSGEQRAYEFKQVQFILPEKE